MSSAKRKVRKMRGKRWHGYGGKKKHRGGGSRGGRGYGGSHKHKYSYITRYEPEHYGYKGFHSLKKKDAAINLDSVQKIAERTKKRANGRASHVMQVIDLKEFGFSKLLSRGELKEALTIKVQRASATAKEKVEKAGGKVVLHKTEEEKK